MTVLLMFVNYVVTMFVVLAVASGALPLPGLVLIPVAVGAEYLVYRASEQGRARPRVGADARFS